MEITVHFKDIRNKIRGELDKADVSVVIAVAWFTDPWLFADLVRLAGDGKSIEVMLMDDEIHRASGIDFQELIDAGGKVYLIDPAMASLMHNKFCVIDQSSVISGSYNWTRRAQSNHENITITKGHRSLADDFIEEFRRLQAKYQGPDDVSNANAGSVAGPGIPGLTVWGNQDLERLRWEIQYLEHRVISLENEKSTIAKTIADFIHIYTLVVGELLLQLLRLKADQLASRGRTVDAEKLRAINDDYHAYREHFKAEKERDVQQLDADEKVELEKLKRRGSLLCHPDKFPSDDEKRMKAEEMFKRLMNAYDSGNLQALRDLVTQLEAGIFSVCDELTLDREKLEAVLTSLRRKLQMLEQEIGELQRNEQYHLAISIKDLDAYLEQEKNRIQQEINDLTYERQSNSTNIQH